MRESDRLGSYWVREGGRLKKRERDREREGGVKQICQNCIPTMNMNSLCMDNYLFLLKNWSLPEIELILGWLSLILTLVLLLPETSEELPNAVLVFNTPFRETFCFAGSFSLLPEVVLYIL